MCERPDDLGLPLRQIPDSAMQEQIREQDEILCTGCGPERVSDAGPHEDVPHPEGCGACIGYPFEGTREGLEIAIEAAEHALEQAFFVVEAEALRQEIARLNQKLKEIDLTS